MKCYELLELEPTQLFFSKTNLRFGVRVLCQIRTRISNLTIGSRPDPDLEMANSAGQSNPAHLVGCVGRARKKPGPA